MVTVGEEIIFAVSLVCGTLVDGTVDDALGSKEFQEKNVFTFWEILVDRLAFGFLIQEIKKKNKRPVTASDGFEGCEALGATRVSEGF